MIRAMLMTRHPMLAKQITVGHIDISNDQTGSETSSHHDIEVYRRAKDKAEAEHFRSGRLEGFARNEVSYYDLLHQALNACAGDGFGKTAKLQPHLQVTLALMEGGTGKPEPKGLIDIERQKGGSDTAARFTIELFATDPADGQLKVFRASQLRNFDVTANGYFDLLRAGLNAAVKDGFY
ncbi:MAG: hypothetical protein OER56_02720 [Hyphomicrobiales bacterium]|nr:hypothetical protein [Hyphomicrobiales bacterium]